MTNHPLIAPKPMPVRKTKADGTGAYRDAFAALTPTGGGLLLTVLATLATLIGKATLG